MQITEKKGSDKAILIGGSGRKVGWEKLCCPFETLNLILRG